MEPKQVGYACRAGSAKSFKTLRSAAPEGFDRRASDQPLLPHRGSECRGVVEKNLRTAGSMAGDDRLKRD